MTLTDQDIDALEARARAATPGPWRYEECFYDGPWHTVQGPGTPSGLLTTGPVNPRDPSTSAQEEADARYLAALSPDVVLALVAEVRRHREALRLVRPLGEPNAVVVGGLRTRRVWAENPTTGGGSWIDIVDDAAAGGGA